MNLQIALIALGVIGLCLIYFYSKYHDRRIQQSEERVATRKKNESQSSFLDMELNEYSESFLLSPIAQLDEFESVEQEHADQMEISSREVVNQPVAGKERLPEQGEMVDKRSILTNRPDERASRLVEPSESRTDHQSQLHDSEVGAPKKELHTHDQGLVESDVTEQYESKVAADSGNADIKATLQNEKVPTKKVPDEKSEEVAPLHFETGEEDGSLPPPGAVDDSNKSDKKARIIRQVPDLVVEPDYRYSGLGETKLKSTFSNLASKFGVFRAGKPRQQTDNVEFAETRVKQTVPISGDKIIENTEPLTTNVSSESQFEYQPPPGFGKLSQIDYWVKFAGEKDLGRETVLAQYNEWAPGIPKSTNIFGLSVSDRQWRNIEKDAEGARFSDLIVTVQLADMNGPIAKAELGRFTNLISQLAQGTGRGFTFMAPVESALQQAENIHRFIRLYDSEYATIIVRPLNTAQFEGGSIARCAEQIGLEQFGSMYVRFKTAEKKKIILYGLANLTSDGKFDFENLRTLKTDGVAFFTRPVEHRLSGQVYSEMASSAMAFAGRTTGRAVTSKGVELTKNETVRVRIEIDKQAKEMKNIGIAAGSDEALKLFGTEIS